MLKIEEIREIIELIDKSSIDKFSYEVDGAKIKLAKNKENNNIVVSEEAVRTVATPSAPAPVAQVVEAPQQLAEQEPAAPSAPAVQDANVYEVTSPMVGTFYEASSPEADPFAKIGQKVQEDTVVCIVEAMKLFNEIEAEVSGEIVDILVQDGQLVEFGQPLFLVKRN